MNIDVSIKPEMRGELDASKLGRILQLLPVMSATFSQANCLAAVSAADVAVFGPANGQHLPTPSTQPTAMPRTQAVTVPPTPLGPLFPDIVGALMKAKALKEREEADQTRVSMRVTVTIPEVALDLTYDIARGRHLVLAVRTLEMQMLFRKSDMQVRYLCSSFIPEFSLISSLALACPLLILLHLIPLNH